VLLEGGSLDRNEIFSDRSGGSGVLFIDQLEACSGWLLFLRSYVFRGL
jgi:hypothetical protein